MKKLKKLFKLREKREKEYEKEKEKFEILRAVTVRSDGKEVKPEKKAIMDVGDPVTYNAPMYANYIMKVVSFPALDSGAVIDYHYRIRSKGGKGERVFYGHTSFRTFEPIERKTYTVTIPVAMEFFYSLVPTRRYTHEDKVTLIWETGNMERVEEEPAIPPLEQLAPTLYMSSFRSWDSAATWIWNRLKEGLKENEVRDFATGKSFEELVSFVKKDIRGIRIPLSVSGYKTSRAEKVLEDRYGDSKDKAILLVSLLRAIGLKAWPTLVSSKLKEFPQIADPSILDRAIVKVEKSGEVYWIDPLMDYSSPPTYHPGGIIEESAVPLLSSLLYSGFEGHMALVFYGDSSRIERVKTHLDNLANTKATLAIDEGGDLKGIFRTEYYGFYDSQVRKILTGKTPEERRRWLKGKLSGVGVGTKLISYRIENLDDLTKPVSVSVEFTLDNYVDLREREVPVILPPNVLSLEDLSSLASMKERKNPLVMKPRRRVSYEIVLSLPEDVEVKNYPIFSRLSLIHI